MTDPSPLAVNLSALRFAYQKQGPEVIDIPSLQVGGSEQVFLRGASGSGKSTLLGLIAGILEPGAGTVTVLGEDMTLLSRARRDAFRAARLGVIFQMFNLLPYMTVGENIILPCRFSTERARAAEREGGTEAEARRLLASLGLDPDAVWNKRSTALSVGQQQRVAAARALIGKPGLILADEPTSALDANSRDAFIKLLKDECATSGAALVFVSHDAELAKHFDRNLDLSELNKASVAEAA